MKRQLFLIIGQFTERIMVIDCIDEQGGICLFEVHGEDGPVLLLTGRIEVAELGIVALDQGVVHHGSDLSLVLVCPVAVSREQFGLAGGGQADDDGLVGGEQGVILVEAGLYHLQSMICSSIKISHLGTGPVPSTCIRKEKRL
jgi:hypothetical protein